MWRQETRLEVIAGSLLGLALDTGIRFTWALMDLELGAAFCALGEGLYDVPRILRLKAGPYHG